MQFKLNDINICGGPRDEIITRIYDFLEGNDPSLIVTFNLDFLRISEENDKFKEVCMKSNLVVADGVGITTLIKLKYGHKIERITGNDLFRFILEVSKNKKIKYAFVGSSEEVLFKLKSKILGDYASITSAFFYSPPYMFEKSKEENNKLIKQLKQFMPNVLFLALGCPRQEIWLYENMKSIGAKINIGVGAAFDFYSGYKKRAPFFVQRIGLEWIWRLITEPRRLFGRYILKDIPVFVKSIIRRKQ